MTDSNDKQRQKMINDYITPVVSDQKIVEAFLAIPRHVFVPDAEEDQAYRNIALPIGKQQTISQPSLVAEMTQLLNLSGTERVLEIGTGSGYQAAILSQLAAKVFSIERIPELAHQAQKILKELAIDNVFIKIGDGTLGWPEEAPFDAIILTASSPEIPRPLIEQLNEDGRMVIPLADNNYQRLYLARKINNQLELTEQDFVRFVPLIGRFGYH